MIRLPPCRLRQDVVSKVETRLPQGHFHLVFARRLTLQEDQPPEDSAATVHMHASCHLFENKLWVQPRHQMLDGKELVFVPHGKRLRQFDLGVHFLTS
jgi:hypothetical protein